MLLGRDAEDARISGLLAAARTGQSGALVLRGEPGIGKSALLDRAVEHASDMTVLRARGVESESELPFAGLAELLAPCVVGLDALPAPQAAALAGALALGPPVAGDRFTVYAATLGLIAAAAERRPLLAAIDDVPWLDAPSREALVFVSRRLQRESVVLLLVARIGERVGSEQAGVPELVLGGLDLRASTALLGRRQGVAVAPEVAGHLCEASGGNPLALCELSSLLTAAQLAGTEAIEEPPPVGANVERAFSRELADLPAATRLALLVAAASVLERTDEIFEAMYALELGEDTLEPAERVGVIAIEGAQLRFRHPLLRTVAYRTMPAPERRAAHRALAASVGGARAAERRAWHLAAAAMAPDEAVAHVLADAAEAARRRGGPAAAMRASERAAQLTPDPDRRARRLLQAAEDRARVGPPVRALELLDEALALAQDAILRADVQHLRGRLKARGGGAAKAAALLLAEAERIQALDPIRAATMLLAAVQPCVQAGQMADALALAERAQAVGERAGLPPMPARLPLAMVLLLRGERRRAQPLLAEAAAWLKRAEDPWTLGPVLIFGIGQAFYWLEDYERARSLLGDALEHARGWSAPGLLPYGLLCLGDLEFRTGHWTSAYAAASEAVKLAGETGQPNDEAYALATLARVEAAFGREQECRVHVARAMELVEHVGVDILRAYLASVLGFLALGLGRSQDAVAPLEDVDVFLRERSPHDPNAIQWAPDLIEAYARMGRPEDAARTLARFESQALESDSRWARAASARCRGLLAGDAEFARRFEEALAAHDTPFETARTQLCFGERLRRAGRRIEARAQLRAAVGVFDRLAAAPWAERARTELRASGERVSRRKPEATERLTAQELSVALTVARGATNREAAAALFLSPKTIEFHLRNVYRKLGLRSRTQLVRWVLSGPAPSSAPTAATDTRGERQPS
jgi:DNA-binding CsgD family transcriptional regulator